MKLWTIQKEEVWEQLQKEKVFICKESFSNEYCNHAYPWMMEQMRQRISVTPPPNATPLWAWLQWENGGKPDITKAGHLAPNTRGICIEFEIPEDHVLLSDYEMWHIPLNRWYLGASEEEDQLFDAKETSLSEQERKRIMEQSWTKIFDLDWYVPYVNRPYEERMIQATFWELHLDSVTNVEHFIAPDFEEDE